MIFLFNFSFFIFILNVLNVAGLCLLSLGVKKKKTQKRIRTCVCVCMLVLVAEVGVTGVLQFRVKLKFKCLNVFLQPYDFALIADSDSVLIQSVLDSDFSVISQYIFEEDLDLITAISDQLFSN